MKGADTNEGCACGANEGCFTNEGCACGANEGCFANEPTFRQRRFTMNLSLEKHSPHSGALHSAATPHFIRRAAAHFICRVAALFIALPLTAADAGYTLGVPSAPTLRLGGNDAWLSANPNYPIMSIAVAGGNGGVFSAQTVAGEERVALTAAEAGFPVERTKPEYYLGDMIDAPALVDWPATYARYLADTPAGFLFDPAGQRVFATLGGTVRFTWGLTGGTTSDIFSA